MDRRERYLNEEETLRIFLRALQARLWTALPGIVQSFNAEQMTVVVQPTINGATRSTAGVTQSLRMPMLLDCPVLWQGGGGAIATFPIAKDDECLVIFSSRCIDGWWSQGGVQNPPELRMHNLSDGFALVGVRSLPKAFAVDTANASLMSVDGKSYFKLNPTTHAISALAPGGITLNGVKIDINGNVTGPSGSVVEGFDDMLTDTGVSLKNHIHGGVQSGGGTTGAPIP